MTGITTTNQFFSCCMYPPVNVYIDVEKHGKTMKQPFVNHVLSEIMASPRLS